MLRLSAALLCVASSSFPGVAQAQERWPWTVEGYLGPSWGTAENDDAYRGSRKALLLDFLVGRRLHSPNQGGLTTAIDFVYHSANLVRTSDCILAPEGGCVPWFPGFVGASLLAGWESRSTNFRVLSGAGPFYDSDSLDKVVGFVGRIDAALVALGRISVTATANALVVPSYNDDAFFFLGIGIGLRLR